MWLRATADLLEHTDEPDQLVRACGALSNMANVARNAAPIAESGLVERVLRLLKSQVGYLLWLASLRCVVVVLVDP